MLSGLPFAIAEELDPAAIYQQVERPIRTAVGDLDSRGLLPTAQGRIVGQNWIAASENTAGRPGLPSGGASQAISLSSQINRERRLQSEAV